MKVDTATALVTGANRGLGKSLVEALAGAGCARVYAASRAADRLLDRTAQVEPVLLDICSDQSVAEAAKACADTTLLINNAAHLCNKGLLGADDIDCARQEMETNYWGTLRMCRAFAPVIAANGGGAIVNILSMGALGSVPFAGSYCASKAAALSLTQCVRAELAGENILVMAVFAGPMSTEMARPEEAEGRHPTSLVAANVLAALEAGQEDVFPDPTAEAVGALYADDPWAVAKQFSGRL